MLDPLEAPFFKGAKVSLVPFSVCGVLLPLRCACTGASAWKVSSYEFATDSKVHVLPRRYAEAVYGGIAVKRGVLGKKGLEDVTHVPPTAL